MLVLQRLGALLSSETVYYFELETSKSNIELELIEQLQVEMGTSLPVKLLEKQEAQKLTALGYGAPLIFSKVMHGETLYYTIDSDHTETVAVTASHTEEESAPFAMLERICKEIFSIFYFWEQDFIKHTTTEFISSQAFEYVQILKSVYLQIATPPPKGTFTFH